MLSKTTIVVTLTLAVLVTARLYSLLPRMCEAPPTNSYEDFKCSIVNSVLRRSR